MRDGFPDLRVKLLAWRDCRPVRETWFHEANLVTQLVKTLMADQDPPPLPTNQREAGQVRWTLREQECVLVEEWGGGTVNGHPVDEVTKRVIREGMTLYRVKHRPMLVRQDQVEQALIHYYRREGTQPQWEPCPGRAGWSIVTLQECIQPAKLSQAIGADPLLRFAGSVLSVSTYREEKAKGASLPATGSGKTATIFPGLASRALYPICLKWSKTPNVRSWDFTPIYDLATTAHAITKAVAEASNRTGWIGLDKRVGTLHPPSDGDKPFDPPPNNPTGSAVPPTQAGRSRPDFPVGPLTATVLNPLWTNNQGNLIPVHVLRLLAYLRPIPPGRKNGPTPEQGAVWEMEALLTKLMQGASINVTSWSRLELANLSEALEMAAGSPWISPMLQGLTRHSIKNGTLSRDEAESFVEMDTGAWEGLLFTALQGEPVTIPLEAWSWRLKGQCRLVAILDQEGKGRGLHRTMGGPCWVTGHVAMQWPRQGDGWSQQWSHAVMVWACGSAAPPCQCGAPPDTTKSCGRCGCEVACGASTHTKSPLGTLCYQCHRRANNQCWTCSRTVHPGTGMRCKGCGMKAHPKCVLGQWTDSEKGCPSLACNPPAMHTSAHVKQPACYVCHTSTLFDTAAQQCGGGNRDGCAKHARVECNRCSARCKHRTQGKCAACRRWWETSNTLPLTADAAAPNKQEGKKNKKSP